MMCDKARVSRVSVEEAARIMGVTPMFIRMGLRHGRLPFGVAVQMPSGRWRYYISAERFERWLLGQDLGGDAGAAQAGA